METSQAVKAVSSEIQKKDSDLYVFQPGDQKERFFIEAALISSAATVILNAFLKGVGSAIEKRVEKWGEQVGTWMGEKLEALFRSKTPPVSENELDKVAADIKGIIARVNADQRAKVFSQVEAAMVSTFEKSGMGQDRAAAIAASARQSAIGLIGGA